MEYLQVFKPLPTNNAQTLHHPAPATPRPHRASKCPSTANPLTWPFPLIRSEASGNKLTELISAFPYSPTLLINIIAAAQRLVDQGCAGIITDCGFRALLQRELAERVSVPMVSSAPCQLPSVLGWVARGRGVGVVTFDWGKLGEAHLREAGVREEDLGRVVVVVVPEGGVLRGTVEEARREYDHAGVEREIVECVRGLVERRPGMAVVLLECTLMSPFA